MSHHDPFDKIRSRQSHSHPWWSQRDVRFVALLGDHASQDSRPLRGWALPLPGVYAHASTIRERNANARALVGPHPRLQLLTLVIAQNLRHPPPGEAYPLVPAGGGSTTHDTG